MSRTDFLHCTPEEFYAAYQQWNSNQQTAHRDSWEQTRVLLLGFLQPYTKKTLSARDVLPFPWDTSASRQNAPLPANTPDDINTIKKRYGLQ